MNDNIEVLISKTNIQKRIKTLANEIDNDFKNEEIIFISVLKGAIYFTMDLLKNIKNENKIIDFIKVSSYKKTESTNKINFQLDVSIDLKNKNVIIIDDILDTGKTMHFLVNYIKNKGPKSIKTCVLLNKEERRIKNITANYVGFEIDNKFVVGYGLDFEEKYRFLPYIGVLKKELITH